MLVLAEWTQPANDGARDEIAAEAADRGGSSRGDVTARAAAAGDLGEAGKPDVRIDGLVVEEVAAPLELELLEGRPRLLRPTETGPRSR